MTPPDSEGRKPLTFAEAFARLMTVQAFHAENADTFSRLKEVAGYMIDTNRALSEAQGRNKVLETMHADAAFNSAAHKQRAEKPRPNSPT